MRLLVGTLKPADGDDGHLGTPGKVSLLQAQERTRGANLPRRDLHERSLS